MVSSQTGSEGYGGSGFDVEVVMIVSRRFQPKVVLSDVFAQHGIHP